MDNHITYSKEEIIHILTKKKIPAFFVKYHKGYLYYDAVIIEHNQEMGSANFKIPISEIEGTPYKSDMWARDLIKWII
jgi:hypothetical protein